MDHADRAEKSGAANREAAPPSAEEDATTARRDASHWQRPASERIAAERPAARFAREQQERQRIGRDLARRAGHVRVDKRVDDLKLAPAVQAELAARLKAGPVEFGETSDPKRTLEALDDEAARGGERARHDGEALVVRGLPDAEAVANSQTVDELGLALSAKTPFSKFRATRKGNQLQIEGRVNPWVVITIVHWLEYDNPYMAQAVHQHLLQRNWQAMLKGVWSPEQRQELLAWQQDQQVQAIQQMQQQQPMQQAQQPMQQPQQAMQQQQPAMQQQQCSSSSNQQRSSSNQRRSSTNSRRSRNRWLRC